MKVNEDNEIAADVYEEEQKVNEQVMLLYQKTILAKEVLHVNFANAKIDVNPVSIVKMMGMADKIIEEEILFTFFDPGKDIDEDLEKLKKIVNIDTEKDIAKPTEDFLQKITSQNDAAPAAHSEQTSETDNNKKEEPTLNFDIKELLAQCGKTERKNKKNICKLKYNI